MAYLKIVIGNLFFTGAYAFIAVPKGIVNGGVTSFAMVLGRLTGIDIMPLTNAMLAALLAACFVFLGRAYFFSALFSGVCYMAMFSFFYSFGAAVDWPFAVCVPAAGALVGVGYYFCISAKSTSVGVDTIAIILHERCPNIGIAPTMYACNFAILSLGWFTYGWVCVLAGLAFAGVQTLTLHLLLGNFLQRRFRRRAER